MFHIFHHRQGLLVITPGAKAGTTLVELLLFLAFFTIVGGTVVSILFATSDQRSRQQTITTVERTGLQMLQGMQWRIEQAERILDPLPGATGGILALQMASESDHPMIIAEENGTLVLVLGETKKNLVDAGPTLQEFSVRNTSPSVDHPSILLSFTLTAAYPLPSSAVQEYSRRFEMLVSLLPKDNPTGDDCGCVPPSCQEGIYRWEVCSGHTCSPASITLPCS